MFAFCLNRMPVGTLAVREQTVITRTPLGMGWYDLEAHMFTSILPHSENKSSSTQKPLPADTEERVTCSGQ